MIFILIALILREQDVFKRQAFVLTQPVASEQLPSQCSLVILCFENKWSQMVSS